MTLNRFITSMIQLGLAVPAYYGVKAIYHDFKSGDFWRDVNHIE